MAVTYRFYYLLEIEFCFLLGKVSVFTEEAWEALFATVVHQQE